MTEAERPFKFDSATAFLTYTHFTCTDAEILEFLNGLTTVLWARIGRELHEDGDPHLHITARFKKRFQSTNGRIFDFKECHPNIQSARSPTACLVYCAKEGNYNDHGPVPSTGTGRKRARLDLDVAWQLLQENQQAEYFRECAEAGLSLAWAKQFWDIQHKDNSRTISEEYSADTSRETQSMLLLGPAASNTNKVTLITGPTGCGKTSWAKRVATKPALFCRHLEDFKLFMPDIHKSIIIDDVSFSHLPRDTQLYLVDMTDPLTIHVRHTVIRLPAGIEKIFTHNHYPFSELPEIKRRIHHIKL